MAKREVKCKVKGRGATVEVTPCENLSQAIDGHRLRLVHLVNLETLTERRVVALKSGRFTKGGVMFNFCPFCGIKHAKVAAIAARAAKEER